LVEQSLHHFINMDFVIKSIHSALKPGGILIINEYVGPDKFQWTDKQLHCVNSILNLLPNKYKIRNFDKKIKRKVYRPGLVRMWLYDPSEAVESSKIVPTINKYFKILESKDYGGNISQLLFQDIAHNFQNDDQDTISILKIITEIEDFMLSTEEIYSDFKYMACLKTNSI